MDNFSGQTTIAVLEKVEEEGMVIVMIPPGTTDRLQPLDVSTNKSAKDFLREKFRKWCAEEVQKQLQAGVAESAVQVNLGMQIMKEVGAQWLTALYDKFCQDKDIVINGFRKVGITDAVKAPLTIEPATDDTSEDPFELEEC